MYYDRFGNTVNYLVANFPGQVASMSMAQQRALAVNQSKIDYPCCKVAVLNAKVRNPLPFIPSASTQALGKRCCQMKWRQW